jgi:TRAP-type C4-dicarboxylate transport system permease large subunit/TRAP-type C4-dicarboxylate transport system permease small subunit
MKARRLSTRANVSATNPSSAEPPEDASLEPSDSVEPLDPAKIGVAAVLDRLRRAAITVNETIDQAVRAFVVCALAAEMLILFVNVIRRSTVHASFIWVDESSQLSLVIVAFIGGAIAYRDGYHVSLRFLDRRMPARMASTRDSLVEWLVLDWGVAQLILGVLFARSLSGVKSPILGIPEVWQAILIAVGGVLTAKYAAARLLQRGWARALMIGVAHAIVLGALYACNVLGEIGASGHMALWVIGAFVVLALIGVPIGFALGLAAVIYVLSSPAVPWTLIPTQMQSGVTSFVLLAIPMFIWAGILITNSGMSDSLVRLVSRPLRRVRGGALYAVVGSIFIFSGISGSKTADVSAIGSAMERLARAQGYSPEETAAALSASAAMSETIPPSVAILVLASYTTLSVSSLFLGGIVPAIVLAVALFVVIAIATWRRPGQRRSGYDKGEDDRWIGVLLRGLPPLAIPVILVGGILLGVGTPTEVSSFAVVVGLVASVAIGAWRLTRRGALAHPSEPAPRKVELATEQYHGAANAASLAGMVMVIVATATAFAWVLTTAGVPEAAANAITSLDHSTPLFMLGSIVLLVVLGALLEGLPALLIVTPILMPVAALAGVSQLQYGIVLLIAMGIGAFLPPIGVGAYVASSVTGARIEGMTRTALPYFLALVAGLIVIGLIPALTLWLPGL